MLKFLYENWILFAQIEILELNTILHLAARSFVYGRVLCVRGRVNNVMFVCLWLNFFTLCLKVNFSLKAINYLVIAKLTPFLHAFGIIFWLS